MFRLLERTFVLSTSLSTIPNDYSEIRLSTDASDTGYDATLKIKLEDGYHPVALESKHFIENQRN